MLLPNRIVGEGWHRTEHNHTWRGLKRTDDCAHLLTLVDQALKSSLNTLQMNDSPLNCCRDRFCSVCHPEFGQNIF